jgi:hypothetical protein
MEKRPPWDPWDPWDGDVMCQNPWLFFWNSHQFWVVNRLHLQTIWCNRFWSINISCSSMDDEEIHSSLRGSAKMGCVLNTPNKLLRHHCISYSPWTWSIIFLMHNFHRLT